MILSTEIEGATRTCPYCKGTGYLSGDTLSLWACRICKGSKVYTFKPYWITLGVGGDLFEGHQLHWADTFYSNATRYDIRESIACGYGMGMGPGPLANSSYRDMTAAEIARYPDLIPFLITLIDNYGHY
jgi:hypothetical protein